MSKTPLPLGTEFHEGIGCLGYHWWRFENIVAFSFLSSTAFIYAETQNVCNAGKETVLNASYWNPTICVAEFDEDAACKKYNIYNKRGILWQTVVMAGCLEVFCSTQSTCCFQGFSPTSPADWKSATECGFE